MMKMRIFQSLMIKHIKNCVIIISLYLRELNYAIEQGMKTKNDFDDLEKQIGNLESDEEENQQNAKKPQKPASKESTPVVKQPPAEKPVTESVPKSMVLCLELLWNVL